MLEAVPINAISRIEVIRGPGSALYGTNAYSGVINIITQKGNDDSVGKSVSASYGSFKSANAGVSVNQQFGENFGIFLAAEVLEGDGYDFDNTVDENGNAVDLDYKDRIRRIYGNFTLEGLSIDFGYSWEKKTTFGLTPVLAYSGIQERRQFYTNAKYSREFSEDFSSSLFLRFNKFSSPYVDLGMFPSPGFSGHAVSEAHMDFGGYIAGVELQTDYRISDSISLISGLSYEFLESDEYRFIWNDDGSIHPLSAYLEKDDSNNIGFYTQLSANIIENINLVAGIRLTKDSDVDDMFYTPRVGLVYKILDDLSLKLLYGEAFRSPNFFEKNVGTYNVLFGSSELDPEKIQTVDIGIEGKYGVYTKYRLNGFIEKTEDGISRMPSPTPATHGANAAVYANLDKLTIYGLEISVNGVLPNNKGFYGINLTAKEGEERSLDEDLLNFAEISANTWIEYRLCKHLYILPSLQYLGDRKGKTNSATTEHKLDDYVLANLVFGFDWKNYSIKLIGKNLLNEDYSYPEYIRNNIQDIPGGAERSLYLQVAYDF